MPVGKTIINNLLVCFDEVLKSLSKELKLATVICAMIDLWSGANKITYIGLFLTFIMGTCKHVGVVHDCEELCINDLEHASYLSIKTRLVGLCPLLDSKTHDSNSIQSTIVHILTNTYGINKNRLYALVRDNAAVNPATAQLLDIQFHGCMAHTMNLAIKDIITGDLDLFGELEELQVKVNAIIAFFNKSSIGKAQAEITKAVHGYCKVRFLTYFGSLDCVYKLKDKIAHFFENVWALTRPRQRDRYDFNEGQNLPDKFDLEANDYCVMYILLKFKDSFDKATKMYSSTKARISHVIPIYADLQKEVRDKCNEINLLFTQNTLESRKVGTRSRNGQIPVIAQAAITRRWDKIAEDKLIVGAYLIAGDRLWDYQKIPNPAPNLTSNFYSYLESIKKPGSGSDSENMNSSLYNEVVEHLVSMVRDLRYYGIGSAQIPAVDQIRRDIKNWINKPLSEYISSYLIVNDEGKFTKDVHWQKVKITNAVVSDLGSSYLFSNSVQVN